MVMEFTGSRCSGYTTKLRFVTQTEDSDGQHTAMHKDYRARCGSDDLQNWFQALILYGKTVHGREKADAAQLLHGQGAAHPPGRLC